MNKIFVTVKKELRSIFRDKKTLRILFTVPLMIPIFIIFYGFMFDGLAKESKEFSIVGVNYKLNDEEKKIAKNNYIKVKYYNSDKELKEKLSDGTIEAYIKYSKKENKYFIYFDEDTQSSQIASDKIVSYLDSYNSFLGNKFLAEQNIDPNKVFNNLSYEIVMEEGENYLLTLIFDLAFTYTIMSIVIAGSNMALSATAAEKENGTLETILTFPIKTSELILGKHLGATVMGIIVSVFSLIVTVIGVFAGSKLFSSFESFQISLSFLGFLVSIIVLVAASILISGLAIALTAFCRTTKEAQSKTQILSFISLIPMFVSILEVPTSSIFYFIPICNYVQILLDIFSNSYSLINVLIVFVSSVLYIGIIISYIIKQYKSEKVLFAN